MRSHAQLDLREVFSVLKLSNLRIRIVAVEQLEQPLKDLRPLPASFAPLDGLRHRAFELLPWARQKVFLVRLVLCDVIFGASFEGFGAQAGFLGFFERRAFALAVVEHLVDVPHRADAV